MLLKILQQRNICLLGNVTASGSAKRMEFDRRQLVDNISRYA
jgi:hypothetical protein